MRRLQEDQSRIERREAKARSADRRHTGCCKCRSSLLQSRIRGPSILLVHGVMGRLVQVWVLGSSVIQAMNFRGRSTGQEVLELLAALQACMTEHDAGRQVEPRWPLQTRRAARSRS